MANKEILCGKQSQIRRNDRTGLQDHDIAGNDFGHRDLLLHAAADDMAVRLDHGIESLDRFTRLALLIVGKTDGDEHHQTDDRCRGRIACGHGDGGDDQKLDDERVLTPRQDLHDEAVLLFLPEVVASPFGPESLHLRVV